MTIDVALEAKRLGMFVVALTSVAHAAGLEIEARVRQEAVRGRRPGARPAGAAGRLGRLDRGLETPVSPVSSVSGCTVINLVKAEVARLLTEAGPPPKVLTAACHLAPRAGELFEETYDDYRRRVGALYS